MELEDQKTIIQETMLEFAELRLVQSQAKRLSFLTSGNGRVLIYTSFKKRIAFIGKLPFAEFKKSGLLKKRFAVDRYMKSTRLQIIDRSRLNMSNEDISPIRYDLNGYITTLDISGTDGEIVLKQACKIYFKWLNDFSDLREVFNFKGI